MAAGGTEGSVSPLLIRLFGPLEVRRDGEPLPPLRTRKGLWLLALLTLHHGCPLDREWLAATLWPDSPEAQALYNLRRSLSDLRRALGTQAYRLRATPFQTLFLDLTGAEVDLFAFDELLARQDEPALETAVRLYQGPLLEGCAEEWAVQERERREQSYLAALEALATRVTARCDHAAAARFLRQAIATDPYRETAHRALMEALAAGGDAAAALLVYRELSRTASPPRRRGHSSSGCGRRCTGEPFAPVPGQNLPSCRSRMTGNLPTWNLEPAPKATFPSR